VLLGALGGLPAGAQQAGKTYRVGILSARTLPFDRPGLEAFRRTLFGLGYQEGANLGIIYHGVGGDYKHIRELVGEIVREKPNAIVANGALMISAAQRATSTIPIIMAQNADPVGSGFVASLSRPGGNVTGTTNMDVELVGKRLQLLKELVPRLQRVAVVRNPANPTNLTAWRKAEGAAIAIGVQVIAVDVRSPERIDVGLKTLPRLHANAILVLPDGLMAANAGRIARGAVAHRLPAVYPNGVFVAAGGLMSYGASDVAIWRQTATYVDRIFKGAKPANLPVERPTTFDLVVNLKTARSLGITFPQSILLRATNIIR